MPASNRPSLPALTIIGLCGLFFVVWFLERFSGISVWDDSYLYTRYADHFIQHGSFAWNVGDPPAWGLTSQFFAVPVGILRWLFSNWSPSLTLYVSSMAFGLGFLYFLTKTILWSGKNTGEKQLLILFLMLILAMNAPQLNYHFSSGMDTAFVLAWESVFLFLLMRWEEFLSPGRAMAIGLWAGLAYFIRPDLLALVVPPILALPLLARRKKARSQGGYVFAFFFFALMAQALFAIRIYGSLLPLPFYVKSLNPYGEAFLEHYRFQGPTDLGAFLLTNFISLGLMFFAFLRYPKQWLRAHSVAELSILAGAVVFMVYYVGFVTHIMSFSQRFYYPLFPILAYLGGKSVLLIARQNSEATTRLLHARSTRAWAWVGAIAIVLVMRGGVRGRPADLSFRFANFRLESAYQYVGLNIWPMLDQLQAFPSDFSVATTELGIPGAMLPDKVIYDLAGLNDPQTAKAFHADTFFTRANPDWIYLPHPHYAAMNADLRSNPHFLAEYEMYDEAQLKCYQGVAIRRKSPYFEEMKGIIALYLTQNHD